MLQFFLSIIPLLSVVFIFFLLKIKVKDFTKVWFCGILSLIITLILNVMTDKFFPNLNIDYRFGDQLSKFFAVLIMFGITEELAKFISLKVSRPKTKFEILSNMIFVSLIFTIYEDYAYIGQAKDPLRLAIFRVLTPVHLVFAVIMLFFLIKAYDAKKENKMVKVILFNSLSLIVPALVHAIYDFVFKDYGIKSLNFGIVILLAIISYGSVLLAIFKYKSLYNESEKNILPKRKFICIFEYAVIILFTLLYFYAYSISM